MRTVFADTAYYVALTNPRDQHYSVARDFTSAFDGAFVTTAWVLTEVANFLSAPAANRQLFLSLLDELRTDSRVAIVGASEHWFDRGLELFRQRPDKEFSLTDCISFAVMQQRGLTEALSSDHHFEQAGFTILLK